MDVCFLQKNRFLSTLAACAVGLFGLGQHALEAQQKLSSEEVTQIAKEGYAFLYPMVLMDTARQQMVSEDPSLKEQGKSQYNLFTHARLYAPPSFRGFVRPNLDTLYSAAWVDLRHGPVILTVPAMENRFALVQVIDMWAEVVANMNRKTGIQSGGKFALVPQGWKGEIPAEVETISCSGDRVWVVVRIAANGPQDIKAVNALQDQFELAYVTPPSPPEVKAEEAPAEQEKPKRNRSRTSASNRKVITPPSDPKSQIPMGPSKTIESLSAEKFFNQAAKLLAENPAPTGRWSTLAMLKQIGIRPGLPYETNGLEVGYYGASSKGVELARNEMEKAAAALTKMENGWSMRVDNVDLFGKGDLLKATLASVGVGTPLPEDILYYQTTTTDEEKRLVGGNRYVLTFNKNELPPTAGFWTLSLYDQDGFLVKNTMARYSLGSSDKLFFDEDGSLTLYLQGNSPGGVKENNWLPTPKWGYYSLVLRIYNPTGSASNQTWQIPPVKRPPSKEELKKSSKENSPSLLEPSPEAAKTE